MERKILPDNQIHPNALKFIAQNHTDIVQEVIEAVSSHKIVLVGMAQNPIVKKARKVLEAHKMEYKYLSYGNYFSKWQERLAIKIWSGWPTYPQIFIDGKLIGGCDDLIKFLDE